MQNYQPFKNPIYVTRPLLPDLNEVMLKLQEIWDAKWLTNIGKQHELLEEELKNVLKVPFLSLFNNGTIALIIACKSLRLSGEVITTPFTFAATPHVLSWNNIKPIFCDIDPVTMNIDAKKIESLITPSTTAILAVHVFGTPCNLVAIQEIADRYGLKVIYDAAHAFETEINGQSIGTFGDITMFSFHATKLFHTAEGGSLTYRDPNLQQRIYFLKNFGIKNQEEVVMPGINGKMNEIQAALGLVVLKYVEGERKKRKIIIDTYRHYFKDVEGIIYPSDIPGVKSSYQYFVIKIDEKLFGVSRDYVYDKLKEYNIYTRKYFHPLCSEYPCYSQLPSSAKSNLPIAHQISSQVLSLPLYGELSIDDVEKICLILKNLRNKGGVLHGKRVVGISL